MSPASTLLGLAVAAAAAGTPGGASSHAEAAEWAVRVETVDAAGRAPALELHLASRAGYHVNLDYPTAFIPAAGSTVTFREARVALAPAGKTPCQGRPQETCAVVLALPGAVPEHGERVLSGTLAFSVCSAERCLIEKVPLGARLPPGVASR